MTTPARAAEERPGNHAGAARGDVGMPRGEDARREQRASADERARSGADERAWASADARARAGDEHARADDDRNRADDDRNRAGDDRNRAGDERNRAGDERNRAGDERAQAAADAPRSAAPPAPPALASASAARRARRRALLHAALGAFGLVALIALIRHVGAAALLDTVSRAAPLLPLLVALEAARIGCELFATRALCPPRSVPFAELARIHVVAYPVASLMPAGRATAEAVKAAMLSPHIGAPRAAAIGTANQSLALLSAAPLSLLAALAVGWTNGASPLAAGLLVHVAVSVASGLGVAFAARQRAAFAWITRRFARAGHATAAFQEAVRAHPPVPAWPFAAFCAGRALQAVQYAVLLAAVGADFGPLRALAAYGVGAIGTAAGDLIPAQIGATDGAFTLAAPLLGLTVSSAIAVSVLAHLLQAVGALAGIAVTFAWRRSPSAP